MIPKFRAWDKRENTMRDVAVLLFTKGGKVNSIEYWKTPSELKSYHVRNLVLMQSTGLKDKNGVEIFEGDLVEHDDNLNGDWETFEACEVVYDKDYAQFCFKWDAGNFLTDYRNLNVIGNIYENPELLERS
ncbi:YopX family protein [Enterococcus faecium]|uniref:YopX family protein n=1 Tax=Enterococcus faecium TaxID=1352 RepID=UPI0021E97C47|nr:YopX family protein [Enterococcus faecium]MCV3204953.1 YopX family protein [Enterococcus faecium]MCV6664211.1 YopX family protein [Enterococcus faecium]